jgi:hypothetical protein
VTGVADVSWPLLLLAALLTWVGIDMLRLSSAASHTLPRSETDRMIFGNSPPPLSDAARRYVESRVLVQPGAARTRLVGVLVLLAGGLTGLIGLGFLG